MENLYNDAVELLKELIATPSLSRGENGTAELITRHLANHGVRNINRLHNNVWVQNLHFDTARPTILLNSHHDTVAPNNGYTRDPFVPAVEGDRLYGLGSNDAGASVVSLLATFLHYYKHDNLKYNLIVAITGEEENSGPNGLESVIPLLGPLDFAIVGEPTLMQLAIAERGLTVVDCVSHGKAGHAAREEGDNAIYKAMRDIEWFRTYRFPKVSDMFGPVKMTVTVINSGTQHNVVPAECRFTVDIRVTDRYTNEEVVETIRQHVECEVIPRSTRLKPSSIDPSHPIVQAGLSLGRTTYGSPTTSDQALLDVPSLKLGVGDSARSHSADEFVFLSEIRHGIELYIRMLDKILIS
ncbi:MAG: M20 family metallo-hydrolase [Rikenellaceae bacterium]|jgi:acetylornithine deacetylase|nr:M20 family metallo-hydrolase [Rikenellaceae bacterium]